MAKQWVVQDQVPRDVLAVFNSENEAETYVSAQEYPDAYEVHEVPLVN